MPFNVTTSTIENETQPQPPKGDPLAPLNGGLGDDRRDFEQNTPLIVATIEGNEDRVKTILARGVSSINAQNIYGYTALLTALSKGNVQLAGVLLDNGANVHISTLEGLTPLHMAVIHCDEATLQRLIQCGAFICAQDEEGDSILHWAVREGNTASLSYLLSHTPVSVDMKNEDGETALHLAAALGDEAAAEILVKAGAALAARDSEGLTPFEHARSNSHIKVAQLLSKAKRGSGNATSSSSSRHDPYRRSCGDAHGEYERKLLSQHHLTELPSANFC